MTLNFSPTPPKVMPIGPCSSGDKCEPLRDPSGAYVSGITVNGKNSGNIISRTGDFKATVKFFFWADKNQMPIKQVCVDFGFPGGKSSGCFSPNNFFKNHRGWKNRGAGASECNGTDFGRAPQACTEKYFSAETTYTCTRGVGPNWTEPCPTGESGCCVFVPRVQVKDNWGWCNGNCPGDPGGDGCYDGRERTTPPRTNECDINLTAYDHWTSFAGKVIVVPK